MKKNGFVMSTYVYMLLVFFLLVILSMLAVLNNSRLLSNKLKEKSTDLNIVLIGNKQINLELGTEYIEPGYVAQTATGEELEVDITSDLDVTHVGTYSITYTAKKGTNTISESRTIIVYKKFVTYITNLYNNGTNEEGLEKDNTSDQNIRYTGSEPNNYVTFNNELWRIIGIFDVATTEGGDTSERIKLVRDESIGQYSWDSNASTVNSGNGYNEWSQADLKSLLNEYYYSGNSITCYAGKNNTTAACPTTKLNSEAKDLIEDAVWNTGAFRYDAPIATPYAKSVLNAYNEERGTGVGVAILGITRKTTVIQKVGLIYLSDYGYASTESTCRSNLRYGITYTNSAYDYTNITCNKNNWLHKNSSYWSLSSYGSPSDNYLGWGIFTFSIISDANVSNVYNIYPSVYLKSSVNVIGGDGTQASPYQLNI